MKVTDLMIGDWVYRKRSYDNELILCQIIATNRKGCTIEFNNGSSWSGEWIGDIEPIPLTPEILEKNGFEPDCDKKYYKNKNWSNLIIRHCIECYEKDFCVGEMLYCYDTPQFNSWFSVLYVHELQHTLKLCGIDKEIVL